MQLDAQWITGFVDGEGCFQVSISPHKEVAIGYQVLPEFTVVQHQRDVGVLYALKSYFGCGVVRTNQGERMAYRVRSCQHLNERILPFFMKHPLKTKKNIEFKKFRRILLMMEKGLHLTENGIEEIRTIAMQMSNFSEEDT